MFLNNKETGLVYELKELIREKLMELGDYPVYITSPVKGRIEELRERFLDLRKNKKLTLDAAIELIRDINNINIELAELSRILPPSTNRKKVIKSHPKRKIIKHKK
jgi:hypothetical protein